VQLLQKLVINQNLITRGFVGALFTIISLGIIVNTILMIPLIERSFNEIYKTSYSEEFLIEFPIVIYVLITVFTQLFFLLLHCSFFTLINLLLINYFKETKKGNKKTIFIFFLSGDLFFLLQMFFQTGMLYINGIESVHGPNDLIISFGLNNILNSDNFLFNRITYSITPFSILYFTFIYNQNLNSYLLGKMESVLVSVLLFFIWLTMKVWDPLGVNVNIL